MIYIITESMSECISQYHQDWRETYHRIIGVFTDKDEFDKAWAQRPKSWRALYEGTNSPHYAEEGQTSLTWDYEEHELNQLFTGDIRD